MAEWQPGTAAYKSSGISLIQLPPWLANHNGLGGRSPFVSQGPGVDLGTQLLDERSEQLKLPDPAVKERGSSALPERDTWFLCGPE